MHNGAHNMLNTFTGYQNGTTKVGRTCIHWAGGAPVYARLRAVPAGVGVLVGTGPTAILTVVGGHMQAGGQACRGAWAWPGAARWVAVDTCTGWRVGFDTLHTNRGYTGAYMFNRHTRKHFARLGCLRAGTLVGLPYTLHNGLYAL